MSTLQVPERPVFNSLEPELDNELSPPISPFAVVAMLLGIFSLTAALAVSIAPFAILVAVLCAVLTWALSRNPSVGGVLLAQIGLCCAVLGATWGLTAAKLTDDYYYSSAGEHAKLFLETLSSGKKFDAFELTLPESGRQVTGTDIEAHYESILATSMPNRKDVNNAAPGPSNETMKSSLVKDEVQEFLDRSATKDVVARGKDAKWQFVRGLEVFRRNNRENRISVVMIDANDPSTEYEVSLNRIVGNYIPKPGTSAVAIWDVDGVKVVKE